MSEAALQRRIQRTIRDMGGWVVKYHGGKFSSAGVPDLLACYKGKFFGFEVKTPEGKDASKIQKVRIAEIQSAGGTAMVVRSVEEVRDALLSV